MYSGFAKAARGEGFDYIAESKDNVFALINSSGEVIFE